MPATEIHTPNNVQVYWVLSKDWIHVERTKGAGISLNSFKIETTHQNIKEQKPTSFKKRGEEKNSQNMHLNGVH